MRLKFAGSVFQNLLSHYLHLQNFPRISADRKGFDKTSFEYWNVFKTQIWLFWECQKRPVNTSSTHWLSSQSWRSRAAKTPGESRDLPVTSKPHLRWVWAAVRSEVRKETRAPFPSPGHLRSGWTGKPCGRCPLGQARPRRDWRSSGPPAPSGRISERAHTMSNPAGTQHYTPGYRQLITKSSPDLFCC